jgi:hypothetical protein
MDGIGKFARAGAAILGVGIFAISASPVAARNDVVPVLVANAMTSPDATGKIDGSVKFYFGDTPHPAVLNSFGEFVTNQKTSSFGKPDEAACNWVFATAMIKFQERAHELGANAVINIHSYFKKQDVSSATQVDCHVGIAIAGVALKGDFVKVAGR